MDAFCNNSNDMIARWGGEEFAVILPQADIREAFRIVDRIRRKVEEHIFSCEKNVCNITVSVGVASIKKGADIDMEQFFKIADKALYKAKEKKNFVTAMEDIFPNHVMIAGKGIPSSSGKREKQIPTDGT
jgi:diguanylate cyclase (GGDEF)-like protein